MIHCHGIVGAQVCANIMSEESENLTLALELGGKGFGSDGDLLPLDCCSICWLIWLVSFHL